MRKLNYFSVVPVFSGKIDFTVSEILRQKKDAGITKIALCLSMHPEGTPAWDRIPGLIEDFKTIREQVRDEVETGVLIQSSQGHGWSGSVPLTDEPFQRTVFPSGWSMERICGLDRDFRNYICKCISAIVEAGAEFLLMDDDFGYRKGECLCPLHLKAYGEALGRELTREEAEKILEDAESEESYKISCIRKESVVSLAREIRAAIDKVNPAIRCGMCTPGSGEYHIRETALALAGNTKPLVRVCNASYGTEAPVKLIEYAVRQAHIVRNLVYDIEDVVAEADTFPQNYYSETAAQFHTHLTQDILSGLTGAKLWCSEFRYPETGSQTRYEKVLKNNMPFYETLYNTVEGIKWKGVAGPLLTYKYLANLNLHYGILRQPDWVAPYLSHFGFPETFANAGSSAISTLTGAEAGFFADEELLKFFSGSLLLDSTAAKLLSKKYSELMGVTADDGDKNFRFMSEKEVNGPLYSGMMWEPSCARLTLRGAEAVTEFRTGKVRGPAGAPVAPAMTFFTNKLGGKVAVCGWTPQMPFHKIQNDIRRNWLLKALDFLSGGTFEMSVEAGQQTLVQHGILADGRELLAVTNVTSDQPEELPVRMKRNPVKAEKLLPSGEWKEIVFRRESGEKVIFDVPLMICQPVVIRMTF